MKKIATFELVATTPFVILAAGASRAMMPLMPRVGWTLGAVALVGALLCLDYALGTPALSRFADWSWERRRRRIAAEDAARLASREAAFQKGLERTRAYAAARAARPTWAPGQP